LAGTKTELSCELAAKHRQLDSVFLLYRSEFTVNYSPFRPLKIGKHVAPIPIIQGGMGVGISLSGLASAVANQGGVGVIAAAGIGRLEPDFSKNLKDADKRAMRKQIREAKLKSAGSAGLIGVNIMMALTDFDDFLKVSVEEEVDVAFIGAGLPLRLPETFGLDAFRYSRTAFVPKVSTARAVRSTFTFWDKRYQLVPDGVVIEGPLAGGHLGFSASEIPDPEFSLEKILPEVVEIVEPFQQKYGRSIPVIAAGGIYSGQDIHRMLSMGVSAVKMGTRFVATHECDAHLRFKESFISCEPDDLVIIKSPVGIPGRAIRNTLLTEVVNGIRRPFKCAWRCLHTCDSRKAPYCILERLYNAQRGDLHEGFAFAGANAHRVDKIVSVKELFDSLLAEYAVCKQGNQPVSLAS
jgi:NAD(P)H-dependent flavin oxidoreductase YrpB (nitropropane dioxygenase family)